MLSRITGFIRDILIARYLGAGVQADAFFAAFRFPNLFRRLFAEGAFAAAYVPLISGKLEDDNHAKAAMFVDQAFAMLGTIVLAVVVAMEICMPLAMWVFTPGFADVPGKLDLTTELSRITFPYLLFISLVSLHASTMNAVGRFAAAAATPVLLNLTLITAIVGFSHLAGGAAYSVFVGGLACAQMRFSDAVGAPPLDSGYFFVGQAHYSWVDRCWCLSSKLGHWHIVGVTCGRWGCFIFILCGSCGAAALGGGGGCHWYGTAAVVISPN
jgi:hypothetical protein